MRCCPRRAPTKKKNPARSSSDRVWIVDPLDGTQGVLRQLGRDDWAVHVALWRSGELVAGAVALPAQNTTLSTPEVAAPRLIPGPPRIVVSRTRPPALALDVRDRLDTLWSKWARPGAKVAAVVQGLADVYVHAGGQYAVGFRRAGRGGPRGRAAHVAYRRLAC